MNPPRFTPDDIAALESGLAQRQHHTDKQYRLVQRLLQVAFGATRDPRSREYKAGVHDMLVCKLCGQPLTCPHPLGTAAADAWLAGRDEGMYILKQRLTPNPTPSGASV